MKSVSFEGAYNLPERTQREIREQLQQRPIDADYASFLGEKVREALQDQGYYNSKVTMETRVLSSEHRQEEVSVTYRAVEGLQYHLGGIHFDHGHVFSPVELRAQIPLEDGDVFDLGKIRLGIEDLTKLYASQGYANFTANPELQVDDGTQTISVRLNLEEDKQFHVAKVQVNCVGLKVSADDLRTPDKPGDIYNANLLGDFYKQNQGFLPPGLSPHDNTQVTQDPRTDTVTIVYDVCACRKGGE